MGVRERIKSVFNSRKTSKQTQKQPHIYANEISKALAFAKDILESKYTDQSELIQRIEIIADGYKNRVETKADVSSLDELSTETLKYLETLISDDTIDDREKVLEIITFALEVLSKIYLIQSQCEKTPDDTLIKGLRCGCKAVKVKYNVLIRSMELIRQHRRLEQSLADLLARQQELADKKILPTDDHLMQTLVEERSALNTSIGQLERMCGLEGSSIPQLVDSFMSVGLAKLDEDIKEASEDAMQLLAENARNLERLTEEYNALMIKRRAIRDEIAQSLKQKTEGQRAVHGALEDLVNETPSDLDKRIKTANPTNEKPLEMEDIN